VAETLFPLFYSQDEDTMSLAHSVYMDDVELPLTHPNVERVRLGEGLLNLTTVRSELHMTFSEMDGASEVEYSAYYFQGQQMLAH
jgi:hypothetical protein